MNACNVQWHHHVKTCFSLMFVAAWRFLSPYLCIHGCASHLNAEVVVVADCDIVHVRWICTPLLQIDLMAISRPSLMCVCAWAKKQSINFLNFFLWCTKRYAVIQSLPVKCFRGLITMYIVIKMDMFFFSFIFGSFSFHCRSFYSVNSTDVTKTKKKLCRFFISILSIILSETFLK